MEIFEIFRLGVVTVLKIGFGEVVRCLGVVSGNYTITEITYLGKALCGKLLEISVRT